MEAEKRKGCTLFPVRYVVVLFITLVCMEMYAHRVVLNVAIVAMVNNTAIEGAEAANNSQSCEDTSVEKNITYNYREGKYVWSQPQQGLILGSFYYGYVIFQWLGGFIVGMLGAKRTYVTTVLVSSVILLSTPFVAELGVAAITCQRVILGMLHGLTYPSGFTILSRWSPVRERSTLMAICVSGNLVGSIVSTTLAGYLCEFGFAGGWPSSFYVTGTFGCFLAFCLIFALYDNPEEFPGISRKELLLIRSESTVPSKTKNIPWKAILTSVPVWATCGVKLFFAFGFYTFLTKLPSYLEVVLHFPIQQNGLINALVYLMNAIGLISSGYLSDVIIRKKYFSVTAVRKGFETISVLGASSCMLAVPLIGCDSSTVIVLLAVATGFMGLVGGGDNSIILNLAPDYTGPLFGLTNGMAAVPGFIAPYIAGVFLDKDQGSIVQWSYVWYLAAGTCAFGLLIFLIGGSAELQPWAVSASEEDARQEKKPALVVVNSSNKL